jgi:hypothetical protein
MKRKYEKFLCFIEDDSTIKNRKCSIENCDDRHFSNGLCRHHLSEFKIANDENYTKSTKVDIQELKEMLANGISQRQIAFYFGVCPAAICKLVKTRKLK